MAEFVELGVQAPGTQAAGLPTCDSQPARSQLAPEVRVQRRRAAKYQSAVAVGLGALAGLLSACSDVDRPPHSLTVHTWWKLPSEAAAWEGLVDEHKRTHDVDIVTDSPTKFKPDLAGRISTDMLSGAPSGTFQANLGADVFRWSVFEIQEVNNGPIHRSSRLRDISGVLAAHSAVAGAFKQELWPDLLRFSYFSPIRDVCSDQECRLEKPLLAIPLNIHRLNLLYYRASSFSRAPTLDALCPQAGRPLEPRVAVNGVEYFPLGLLFFENLFLAFLRRDSPSAQVAAERYYDFFAGSPADAASSEADSAAAPAPSWEKPVRDALECLHRMSVVKVNQAGWENQVHAVSGGAAEVTAMGDWASVEIRSEVREGEMIPMPFPGTDEFFVFTSDAFPLPIGARFPADVEELMVTLADPARQRRFSDLKGSLPAVGLGARQTDFEQSRCPEFLAPQDGPKPSGFDEARCRNLTDLHRRVPLLATSGLIVFDDAELRAALIDVIDSGDEASIERAVQALAEASKNEFGPFQRELMEPAGDWVPPPRIPLTER